MRRLNKSSPQEPYCTLLYSCLKGKTVAFSPAFQAEGAVCFSSAGHMPVVSDTSDCSI
ncbi:hypothetical protein [Paludibacter sp. 221]|uniref:hypothetical protein n=1 Tax=Paludibacter sp. 221 TaxID=2302939 RepID=UPI0013CF8E6A|nr:hypothetical protein [Paludibacter sp. 221]